MKPQAISISRWMCIRQLPENIAENIGVKPPNLTQGWTESHRF